jgi:hypothetical protein
MDGVIYRAIPNWKGNDWYDWALVKFPKTPASSIRNVPECDEQKSVARILTFFRHKDMNVPTFKYTEQQDQSWEDIQQHRKRDSTTYMILHCQRDNFSLTNMQNKFIVKYKMTSLTEMYVLPIDCIVSPLLVIPDFIAKNKVSTSEFMAILPRHKQGPYFTNYIHSDDSKYDFSTLNGKSSGDNDHDDDESIDNVDAELFSDGITYEMKEAETYSDEESCDSENEFDLCDENSMEEDDCEDSIDSNVSDDDEI